jgi:hypothetical protein
VSDDLARLAKCERLSSCLSGVSGGGYGPVAEALKKQADRAGAIATSFDRGDADRRQWLKDLNRHSRRYQEKLAEVKLAIGQRRVELQAIHTEVEQVALAMTESLPIGMLKTFTDELQAGVTISGQYESTQRLNAVLGQHGDMLAEELETLGDTKLTPPSFPRAAGMLDSLRYVSEFAAFAAVIFVAELVLPVTLLLLTFLRVRWEIEKRTPAKPQGKPDYFNGLMDDMIPSLPADSSHSAGPSATTADLSPAGAMDTPQPVKKKRGRPKKVAS